MYYLFERNPKKLEKYKAELLRVKASIKAGTTPVYCEVRNANTTLFENLPFYTLSGVFLILGTWLLSLFKVPTILDVAAVFIMNNLCQTIANYIFTMFKHYLRIKLCKRLGLEPNELIIACMESLEYQSVCNDDVENDNK